MKGYWRFDPASYDVGSALFVSEGGGFNTRRCTRYEVVRRTPSGQLVAKRGDAEIRITPRGAIVGVGTWSTKRIVSAETAAEILAECRVEGLWLALRVACEAVDKAARHREPDEVSVALASLLAACAAQGIEAAEAGETAGLDPKGESPVGETDAPNPPEQSS